MILFSGGRNLPDRAARDRHVCLFGMLIAGDFVAIVKVPAGEAERAACIRLTVLPIRRSIGYRSLRKSESKYNFRWRERACLAPPLLSVNAGREIFRLGPRKFSKFCAHAKLWYVCALSAFLIATQEISERHSFQRRNWKEGKREGLREKKIGERRTFSEIVFNAL